jgi:hypothetical protein
MVWCNLSRQGDGRAASFSLGKREQAPALQTLINSLKQILPSKTKSCHCLALIHSPILVAMSPSQQEFVNLMLTFWPQACL